MQEENIAWGEKFRLLVQQSGYRTLEEVADALDRESISADASRLSHWQNGRRIPAQLYKHMELMAALVKVGVISTSAEVNELQHLAGFRPLSPAELTDMFQQERTAPLEPPDGPMRPTSPFYIERAEDKKMQTEIAAQGISLTILGPRYVGKSSMLLRLEQAARQRQKAVAHLDCRTFGQQTLAKHNLFFGQFCLLLAEQIGLEEESVELHWRKHRLLSSPLRCTRYVQRHILQSHERPLLLTLEAVDTLFETPIQDDFFSMLRSWHEKKKKSRAGTWRKLDVALVTSTEPYQFIKDLTISPFNVGTLLELSDFTIDQVKDLNQRYPVPLPAKIVENLFNLTEGHPYLVQQAFYWLATEQGTPEQLFAWAALDYGPGPFKSHLSRLLRRLSAHPDQQVAILQVINRTRLVDQSMSVRLRGAGLIRRGANPKQVLMRCPLYARYLKERLDGEA